MDKFLKGIGMTIVVAIVLFLVAALFAFPVKWAMNYLFTPQLLLSVFGVPVFTAWRAWALSFLTTTLLKSHQASK